MSAERRINFNADSEAQKKQFIRACEAAGETQSDVLRSLVQEFIDENLGGSTPDALELAAIELEQEAEELG